MVCLVFGPFFNFLDLFGPFWVRMGPFSILKASNHNASTRRIHPRSPEDSMNFLQLFLFLRISGPWAGPMGLAHGPCPWAIPIFTDVSRCLDISFFPGVLRGAASSNVYITRVDGSKRHGQSPRFIFLLLLFYMHMF